MDTPNQEPTPGTRGKARQSFLYAGGEWSRPYLVSSPRRASMAAWRLVKGPQYVRVKVCKSDRLRYSNTVGFIPHCGKQCADAVCPLSIH
jgi:hypothetical protein